MYSRMCFSVCLCVCVRAVCSHGRPLVCVLCGSGLRRPASARRRVTESERGRERERDGERESERERERERERGEEGERDAEADRPEESSVLSDDSSRHMWDMGGCFLHQRLHSAPHQYSCS